MIIKVIQSHIDRGCRGDGAACPVALAILEQTSCDCIVESDRIGLGKSAKWHWTQTPKVVADFIDNFDHGLRVVPFEFELDVEGVG